MISYRDMSDKELEEYRKMQKEEFDKKYKGKIDPVTLRWLSSEDANSAAYLDGKTASVKIK